MDVIGFNEKAWDRLSIIHVYTFKHSKHNQMFRSFCEAMPSGANVLDLGCGTGIPITKKLVENGFKVTALDLSGRMIKQARKNVSGVKRYVKSSMTEMDFIGAFDGIVSSFSMLCLDKYNFGIASRKIVDALKVNGHFLLFLNEPPPKGHKERENVTEILGEKMFSRPYTEEEVIEFFPDLKIVKTERQTITSKMYGKEYTLLMMFKKLI